MPDFEDYNVLEPLDDGGSDDPDDYEQDDLYESEDDSYGYDDNDDNG